MLRPIRRHLKRKEKALASKIFGFLDDCAQPRPDDPTLFMSLELSLAAWRVTTLANIAP